MDPLPLGSDWKIIRNHRSLTTEDRENSDIDFTKSTKEKFDDSLASIAHASNGTVKLTEIENYRPDDYMRESVKIFCDDEINRQKRLHLKKIAEYQYQEMQSQDIKLRQKMEKESRIIQQVIMCIVCHISGSPCWRMPFGAHSGAFNHYHTYYHTYYAYSSSYYFYLRLIYYLCLMFIFRITLCMLIFLNNNRIGSIHQLISSFRHFLI